MLLPKFSIRLLLLIMVGVAIFTTVITYAIRGNPWMLGLAAGLGSLAVVTMVYLMLFLFFALLAAIMPRRRGVQQTQPSNIRPPLPESPH